MRYAGLLNGSALARSTDVNAELTVNWIPELSPGGQPKVPISFYRAPGSIAKWTIGKGPVRALFEQDGRCFGVSGDIFFELFKDFTAIVRGTVAAPDARPATISSSGTFGYQLFITSGGYGYIYNLEDNTLTQIIDDAFPYPCLMGLYFDGYFIGLNEETGAFAISGLPDISGENEADGGLSWNGIDLGIESQVSDLTRAIIRSHDNLILFGQKHASPWYDSGNSSFPFQPVQGTLIEHGIDAPFSMVNIDNTVIYLGRDTLGRHIVWRLNGYTPERISTHAIEYYLARLPRTDDAIGWAYMDEGHLFYMLYLSTAKHTLVYDVTTRLWHHRARWNLDTMDWMPHFGRCYCYAFGMHLIGSHSNGSILQHSLDFLYDQPEAS